MKKFNKIIFNLSNSYFYKYFLYEIILIDVCLTISLLCGQKFDKDILNGEDLEIICFVTVFIYFCILEMFHAHKLTLHLLNAHVPLFKSVFFYKVKKFYCSLVINHIEILAFVLGEIYASSPSLENTNSFVFDNSSIIIFFVIPLSFTIFTIMDKNNKEALLCNPNLYNSTFYDRNNYLINLKHIKHILSSQKSEITQYNTQREDIIKRIDKIIRIFK